MSRRGSWFAALLLALGACFAPPADSDAASLAGLAKEQGNGSRFSLESQGSTFDMNIGLVKVDAAASRAVIEVYASDQFSDPLWQQFMLDVKGDRPAVESGYIQVGNKAPMILTKQYLSGIGNLDVGMFLLSEADLRAGSSKDLKSLGQETITSAAGQVRCLHYRAEKGGQTLDFWASDEAKPIGLVRMVSTGKKKEDNYRLELKELLSGIAPKIDPSKAGPLSDEMKAILTKR
ncbi:MAG: hypothetical protein KGL03_09855 [Nitrospirota bacterium]|nr:hypothetical protein [Nitrospirota bacterium]